MNDPKPSPAAVAPLSSALSTAPSFTNSPRAVLTRTAPGFICATRACDRKPEVEGSNGKCRETTSLWVNNASSETDSSSRGANANAEATTAAA